MARYEIAKLKNLFEQSQRLLDELSRYTRKEVRFQVKQEGSPLATPVVTDNFFGDMLGALESQGKFQTLENLQQHLGYFVGFFGHYWLKNHGFSKLKFSSRPISTQDITLSDGKKYARVMMALGIEYSYDETTRVLPFIPRVENFAGPKAPDGRVVLELEKRTAFGTAPVPPYLHDRNQICLEGKCLDGNIVATIANPIITAPINGGIVIDFITGLTSDFSKLETAVQEEAIRIRGWLAYDFIPGKRCDIMRYIENNLTAGLEALNTNEEPTEDNLRNLLEKQLEGKKF